MRHLIGSLLVIVTSALASCTLPSDITQPLSSIVPGESYGSVVAKLGSPKNFKDQGNVRVIQYCNYGWVADETVVIAFRDSRVVEIARGDACGPNFYVPPPVMPQVTPILNTGSQTRMCPDGTYVTGSRCKLMPDGSYLGVDGGQTRMCPDGTYVAGSRCKLMPNGTYLGVD